AIRSSSGGSAFPYRAFPASPAAADPGAGLPQRARNPAAGEEWRTEHHGAGYPRSGWQTRGGIGGSSFSGVEMGCEPLIRELSRGVPIKRFLPTLDMTGYTECYK